MTPYNGHRSYNAWNVSLWINNDYGLYQLAKECCRAADTVGKAAGTMRAKMDARTPDGGVNNQLSVKLAIQDIFDEIKKEEA